MLVILVIDDVLDRDDVVIYLFISQHLIFAFIATRFIEFYIPIIIGKHPHEDIIVSHFSNTEEMSLLYLPHIAVINRDTEIPLLVISVIRLSLW